MSTTVSGQSVRRTKSTRTFTKYLAAVAGTVALVAASLAFAAPAAHADDDYEAEASFPVTATVCFNGVEKTITVTGEGEGSSKHSYEKALDEAQRNAAKDAEDQIEAVYPKHHDGACKKITICHFVSGKGETKDGYNVITISEHAWLNGHSDGDYDGHDSLDVEYNGTSCPEVTTTFKASDKEYWDEDICVNGEDINVKKQGTGYGESTVSKAAAQQLAHDNAVADAKSEVAEEIAEHYGTHTDGKCVSEEQIRICHATGEGNGNTGNGYSDITINLSAWPTHQGHGDFVYNGNDCLPFNGSAQAQMSHGQFCYAGNTSPGVTTELYVKTAQNFESQAAADQDARSLADSAATDELNTLMAPYADHTDGACAVTPPPVTPPPATPEPPAVVSAAEAVVPAAEPLPATVPEAEVPAIVPEAATVPEAEPVAAPEAATVPQAVPAGGGSSSNENGPTPALLLLVFAATAVCLGASARLLATRTR